MEEDRRGVREIWNKKGRNLLRLCGQGIGQENVSCVEGHGRHGVDAKSCVLNEREIQQPFHISSKQ